MPEEIFKPPVTSDGSLTPGIIFSSTRIQVKFNEIFFKQSKIYFGYSKQEYSKPVHLLWTKLVVSWSKHWFGKLAKLLNSSLN